MAHRVTANTVSLTLSSSINRKLNSQNPLAHHNEPPSIQTAIQKLGLNKLIITHEKEEEKGYVSFEGWMAINQHIWGQKIADAALQLWKVLRLLNRGDVLLPTDLLIDVLAYLMDCQDSNSLEYTIESFLRSRCPKENLSSYRELSNYPSLSAISHKYTTPPTKEPIQVSHTPDFRRLFEGGRSKNSSRIRQLQCQSILQEIQECSFRPSLRHKGHRNKENSKAKKSKQVKDIRLSKGKENRRREDMSLLRTGEDTQQQETDHLFKARAFRKQLLEGSVVSLPGAKVHIQRHLAGECQRQRTKRYLMKPKGTLHY